MAPQLYGWQHLTYLAIFFAIFIATIVLTKIYIKTDKQKTILIKCVAALLLAAVVTNRISIAIRYSSIISFIPSSYCGVTSLVLSIIVLCGKPNNKAYGFLFYMGLIGGLATMFYPDFLGQNVSFMYLPTISGLLHHSILLTLCILLLQTGWYRPQLKDWWIFPLGMGIYTLYGLFLMDIFDWDDAMSINSSLVDGTPINWWFILLVGTILVTLFLFIYNRIEKKKEKNKNI